MKSKINSPRRLAANRANSKKSTGPKTADGKAISSLNSLRHGLSSTTTTFIVHNDDLAEYNSVLADYVARLAPRNQAELDAVERIVQFTWNQQRIWTLDDESLSLQMDRMAPQFAEEFVDFPQTALLAAAFEALAKQPGATRYLRYDARASLEIHRAFATLLALRKSDLPLAAPCTPVASLSETLEAAHQVPVPIEANPISERPAPSPESPPASYTEEETVHLSPARMVRLGNVSISRPAIWRTHSASSAGA